MRIITSVKCKGKRTIISIKKDLGSKDSVHEVNVGNAVHETILDMLIGCARDPDAKGLMTVECKDRTELKEKLINSNNRMAVDEALLVMKWILAQLPHLRTRAQKEEIKVQVEECVRRLSI